MRAASSARWRAMAAGALAEIAAPVLASTQVSGPFSLTSNLGARSAVSGISFATPRTASFHALLLTRLSDSAESGPDAAVAGIAESRVVSWAVAANRYRSGLVGGRAENKALAAAAARASLDERSGVA